MKNYRITKHINRNIVLDVVRKRINQIGKIKTCDVAPLQKNTTMCADSFCEHFRVIMMGMVRDKKAKRLCNGSYEIIVPYDCTNFIIQDAQKYIPTKQVIDFLKRELKPI